jgi:hypothetical protein
MKAKAKAARGFRNPRLPSRNCIECGAFGDWLVCHDCRDTVEQLDYDPLPILPDTARTDFRGPQRTDKQRFRGWQRLVNRKPVPIPVGSGNRVRGVLPYDGRI